MSRCGGRLAYSGYGTASFAIKVGHYILAGSVFVFVAMLILTAYS